MFVALWSLIAQATGQQVAWSKAVIVKQFFLYLVSGISPITSGAHILNGWESEIRTFACLGVVLLSYLSQSLQFLIICLMLASMSGQHISSFNIWYMFKPWVCLRSLWCCGTVSDLCKTGMYGTNFPVVGFCIAFCLFINVFHFWWLWGGLHG